MRKIDLAHTIAEKAGLTHVKAEQVVDVILEAIKANLSRGEPVILRRFGSFGSVQRIYGTIILASAT